MKKEFTTEDVVKIVLMVLGAVLVVTLLTWVVKWGVIAAALYGAATIGWKLASDAKNETRALSFEAPMSTELVQLEAKQRVRR